MYKLSVSASFFKSISSCCTAVMSVLLLTAVIACTGNGGSAYSEGGIYNPESAGGG